MDIDKDGKIWFTDTPNSKIGNFDPKTEQFEIINLPQFTLGSAFIQKSIPTSVAVDHDNDVWIAVIDKSILLQYDQTTKKFRLYNTLTEEAGPTAIEIDSSNNVWFAESLVGNLGKIDAVTGQVTEFTPDDGPLAEPFALMIDKDENIWIAEHIGPFGDGKTYRELCPLETAITANSLEQVPGTPTNFHLPLPKK